MMLKKSKSSAASGNRSGSARKNSRASSTLTAPALIVNDTVVFPNGLSPMVIEGDSAAIIKEALAKDRLIAVFPEIPGEDARPEEISEIKLESQILQKKDVTAIGTLVRIVKVLKFPDGTLRILLRGLCRIKFSDTVKDGKLLFVSVKKLKKTKHSEELETEAMLKNILKQFHEIISYSPGFPEELKIAALNIEDNDRLVDMIADTLHIGYFEKISILALPTLMERIQLLTILLNREVEVIHLGSEIQAQVHSALSKSQREYFLRQQLKTIKQQLGEETRNPDIAAIEEKMRGLTLPEAVENTIKREIERLQMIPQASSEYHVAHTYIDWLLETPWNKYSDESIDVKKSAKVLEKDHYGLKDVKERILEFLAVLQLRGDKKSPIICFVGPPGVGKTSLGKSIAEATGRRFVRMSLGGMKDEAEIRGHRRTYVGALPGRIIQGLKRAGVSNPVFMLDEIDKVGKDFRGDPASALLEVLDPQQNHAFNDHYMELDFDLSSVMFIATANISETIPPALLDRMEIIKLPGYTPDEKKRIAIKFLIPRQVKENGLSVRQITFTASAVDEIITYYTREAGVRNLERSIGSICRKIARKLVEKSIKASLKISIRPVDVKNYLGPRKYFMDEAEKKPEKGVATGMAWTSAGGAILPVETAMMPGKGELKLTGSLGDVMKESAMTAFSFIKSFSRDLEIDHEIFSKNDFHVHVPDGATPKDGPSAGITIAVSLISLLISKPLPRGIAMTGEITLRGKITPVGGIKEKTIAALRAGIKTVLLPEKNRKDLEGLPAEVKKKLKFEFFESMPEFISFLFNNNKPKRKKDRR